MNRINLHLHTVGDRAVSEAFDAVAIAIEVIGGPLSIEITPSYLELDRATDFSRFRELGVHANFTPHWFGGDQFGGAGRVNLGAERDDQAQRAGRFFLSGANVTLSSDVTNKRAFLTT